MQIRRLRDHTKFWMEDWRSRSRIERAIAKIKEGSNSSYANLFGTVMDEAQPDVVNTHSMVGLTPLLWREADERGIPVVHTLRDYDLLCSRSTMFRNCRTCSRQCLPCRLIVGRKAPLSQYVTSIVGISDDILTRHVALGHFSNIPDELREKIWNATTDIAKGGLRTSARDRLTFGFIGRISPEKGLDTLIQACRQLPPRGWTLKIAGRPPEPNQISPASCGLPIEWLGWTPPEEFFTQIDVLVVPSVWAEPLGRVTIEAFSYGVPVLGSKIGGTLELISERNSGWLFPPGDANALAKRMQALIDGGHPISLPAKRMEEVVAATRPVVVAEQYLRLYERVVPLRRVRRS